MKRKVVIFVNSLLSGGAERFVSLILNELHSDFEFHLLVLEKTIEYKLPENQIIFDLGSQGVKSADFQNFLLLPKVAFQLKKYCKQNNIEIVISFLSRPNLAACLARMLGMKSKLMISERTYTAANYGANNLRGRIGRRITCLLYPYANWILPNSQGTEKALKCDFGIKSNYAVIKNAIVLDEIEHKRTEKVTDAKFDRFTFVSLAGFRTVKNHRMLISAFAKLEDEQTQLLLVGTGYKAHGEGFKVFQEMKDYVKLLGLEERILFLGQQSNPFKYLSRSDCFVLSSDFEGFPTVIIEALACSLPVISTDCPTGAREILGPPFESQNILQGHFQKVKFGILTPVGDEKAMTCAMREVLNNSLYRDELKAKAQAAAHNFDAKIVMTDFKHIIDNAF